MICLVPWFINLNFMTVLCLRYRCDMGILSFILLFFLLSLLYFVSNKLLLSLAVKMTAE